MATKKRHQQSATADTNRSDASERAGSGAVEGLGGAGGSSGAGSVRAKPKTVGELSGLDQRHGVETPPIPGSTGAGAGREATTQDGGLSGQTRGNDNESVPNREEPGG